MVSGGGSGGRAPAAPPNPMLRLCRATEAPTSTWLQLPEGVATDGVRNARPRHSRLDRQPSALQGGCLHGDGVHDNRTKSGNGFSDFHAA